MMINTANCDMPHPHYKKKRFEIDYPRKCIYDNVNVFRRIHNFIFNKTCNCMNRNADFISQNI